MPGRRKPDHLKLLHGTFRPSRAAQAHVELPLVNGTPEPPEWLTNPHAIGEWRRLAPILAANRLLTEASLGPFALLCSIHGALVQASAAGTAPHASLLAQYRAFANDFGLTYAGMQKLRPYPAPSPAAEMNPFEALREWGDAR